MKKARLSENKMQELMTRRGSGDDGKICVKSRDYSSSQIPEVRCNTELRSLAIIAARLDCDKTTLLTP